MNPCTHNNTCGRSLPTHQSSLGYSLRRLHSQGSVVCFRKQSPHQFSGIEGGSVGLEMLRAPLQEPDCPYGNGHKKCLHKQGMRYEIRLSLFPALETPIVVQLQEHCDLHHLDCKAPYINQIADFLLYLFQEKKLQPSTIDGYHTATADKVGNSSFKISKNENLTWLLDIFYRDRPKGCRSIPSWNLSLVLYRLNQTPFEPLRKASVKHLTFKSVFMLALASGKHRSEIHAWINRNIHYREDWSKVSTLCPIFSGRTNWLMRVQTVQKVCTAVSQKP